MSHPLWGKVLRDLWEHKARTLLAILSIAVGVFAIGMIAGSHMLLSRELTARYAAANPASATLYTDDPFDEALVEVVRGMRQVQVVEGRRRAIMRLNVGADEWRDIELVAIPDYDDIRVNKVWPEHGAWPPPERELLIERSALGLAHAQVGDTVIVETPTGKQREMRIAGLAHDLTQPPAIFTGVVYGYITFDTLEWLGEPRAFDELHILVAEHPHDRRHINAVAGQVRDKIEKSGRTVLATWVPEPGRHPVEEVLTSILLLLGALGALALLLSGFLVINTISALMAQQIRQIGVMKAIGARTPQVMDIYLSMVLIFGLLALLIGIPLGTLGAGAFTRFIAGLINIDIVHFGLPPQLLAIEILIGLVVPFLAALYPIMAGCRITVREALSSHGIVEPGTSRTSALAGIWAAVFNYATLLSLRNTFRRKRRLALTLLTLTLGGAMFIAIFSVRDSMLRTLDEAANYWQYDISLQLNRPARTEYLVQEALRVPGVAGAESWGFAGVRRVRPDATESDTLLAVAPPADTDFIQPTVLQGRWLLPEDANALVLNTDVLRDEPDIAVGDEIVLTIDGRDTRWQVVGVVQSVLSGPIVYANDPHFARVSRAPGRASGIQVVTTRHDPAFQAEVARALEHHFEQIGIPVNSTETTTEVRARVEFQFSIIVFLLLIMATLLALVGGLGLMGTMSINVLERTREIGVMRAIGASNGAVFQIVLTEGICIGALSWLCATILAFPMGKLLSDAVGVSFVGVPLHYTFSVAGILLWLALVLLLAALASFLPAWNATRLTVRDVLAYE